MIIINYFDNNLYAFWGPSITLALVEMSRNLNIDLLNPNFKGDLSKIPSFINYLQ